ncbi:MAG: hypothetical protein PQJ61_16600 [Spirochaetales bacterium]|uniref:Uncharacterized protein n=1 Tax=Candidatus Thalassospirochaeta sargassi TaxID=3119039 RepID=A0AAJ1IFI1_9SPIO|nr:hypothetical protein [Spirochaetales bacterium]
MKNSEDKYIKNEIPDWLIESIENQNVNDPVSCLGQVIISFQELEHVIVEFLGELIGNIDNARIIATEISFRKLLNIIESILNNDNNPMLIDKFTKLKKEITDIENARNRYVHSYYEIIEETGDHIKYLRMKNRNKSGLIAIVETIDDNKVFIDLLEKITEMIIEVLNFDEYKDI